MLHPDHIYYTQETIRDVFQNGIPLIETLEQLRSASITVNDIPPIKVLEYEGKWWTIDNRRLWVFREYGQVIPVEKVNEEYKGHVFYKRKNTQTKGKSILFCGTKRNPLLPQTIHMFPELCIITEK